MGGFELRRPSAAMVVALTALFVSLTGTAVAAGVVPLAKRALVADNARKLGGKTGAEVTASAVGAARQAAAQPGPASTAASLATIHTVAWSLNASQSQDFTTPCAAGQKAIAGGYDNPTGDAIAFDNRPSADGGSWRLFLLNVDATTTASGTLYVVCLK